MHLGKNLPNLTRSDAAKCKRMTSAGVLMLGMGLDIDRSRFNDFHQLRLYFLHIEYSIVKIVKVYIQHSTAATIDSHWSLNFLGDRLPSGLCLQPNDPQRTSLCFWLCPASSFITASSASAANIPTVLHFQD